jgi:hypothetical protein
MISQDYLTFPEFREGYFKLIESIIKHCTNGLFKLDWNKFQTIMQTIYFAMNHEKPDLMDIGLNTLHALIFLLESEV